ncbi:MAG: hypothetical protein RL095_623 [Verrucomicrobiota bacterium]|jgi:RNA polymerase sigma-70 factor (ECF subfamily)
MEGDRHSEFLRLYTEVQGPLFRYICALHPNFSEVDDIVQEVAVTAWAKFGEFPPGGEGFRGWIFGVARHKILHSKRKFLRGSQLLDRAQEELAAQHCSSSTPVSETRISALSTCLAQLPEKHRDLLRLRYHDKLSCIDLAVRFQHSHEQVRVQLHRLRAALKSCISRQESSLGKPFPGALP